MAQATQALTIEGQLHMDEAQKKIVKLPKYGEPTGKHYQHLINFLQGEHTKTTNTPYQMYGKFNIWSNSEEGEEPYEVGYEVEFASDAECEKPTGIRIFEYREDDEEGCESNKALLALNGRKFKVTSAMPFSSAGDYLAETTITLID